MADAIVIGAGINGLTAAAALAAKGWGVTVFERNEEIGGAVRTAELTEPGFRHDWGRSTCRFSQAPAFTRASEKTLPGTG